MRCGAAARRLRYRLVAVGTLILVPFGLWLVSLEHVGYDAAWVDAALALLVVALALGAAGGKRPRRARRLAARLAREGGCDDRQLRRLLGDRVSLALNYLSALVVLTIIVLMVVKP